MQTVASEAIDDAQTYFALLAAVQYAVSKVPALSKFTVTLGGDFVAIDSLSGNHLTGLEIVLTNYGSGAITVDTSTGWIATGAIPSNSGIHTKMYPTSSTRSITTTTKAKVYLGSANDTFTASNSGATVFGGTGSDTVKIASSATGVTTNANIERIELAGNLNTYKFAVMGNQVIVYSGTTTVLTLTASGSATGQTLVFADGSAAITITGLNAVKIGGTLVPTVAAAVAATLNPNDRSTGMV